MIDYSLKERLKGVASALPELLNFIDLLEDRISTLEVQLNEDANTMKDLNKIHSALNVNKMLEDIEKLEDV